MAARESPPPPAPSRRPVVRAATAADAGTMAAIHAAAFPAPDAWGRDVFSLHAGLPNVVGLLHADEALVLARAAAGEAEILTLAVVPKSRRKGLATALLHEALTRLAAAGASVVFLEASVSNTAALTLYSRIGFTEAGRRRAYYPDGSDAIVFRLYLVSSN